jgi:Ser/Thr protein kinase RdoA (MazF antagonist)
MDKTSLIDSFDIPSILAAYGLENCTVTFLQHSDSITYQARAADVPGAFLLRLHIPVTAALGAHGANPVMLRSELAWLEALARDTDLVLQQPVRNLSGELVTNLLAERDHKPYHATLLTWLEGEPYRRELESEGMASQLGAILARQHNHASLWQPPSWLARPLRDGAYFDDMLAGLRPAVERGRITLEDFTALAMGVRRLQELMCSLGSDPQRCGIMHADPHKGNLLFQGSQVRLIDFSFCAVGDYLFDLSIALADLQPALHPALLDGYQSVRSLPDGFQLLAQAFYLGMMVGTFNYLAARPETQAILTSKAPQVAQLAARFCQGESFWFNQ